MVKKQTSQTDKAPALICPDDEICICGHSKGYHTAHALDEHGGACEKCGCKEYTWKSFVNYEPLD